MKIKHCKLLITSVAAVFRWLLLSPCTRSSATPLDRLSCVWTVILLMILYFQEVNTVTGRQIWGVRQVVSEACMSVAENPHSSDRCIWICSLRHLRMLQQNSVSTAWNESMMHNQINVEKNAERSSKFPQPDVLPLDLETLVFDWKLLGHS